MQSRSKYLVLTTDYLIPLGIILLIIIGYFVSFYTSLFSVRQVICTLDYKPCENPNIISELDKSLGHNLLSLDTDIIESCLLSGEYTIRSAQVSRAFPNTLTLNLLSTYPVIALQLSDNPGEWIALDSRNRVIAVVDHDPNVPIVTLDTTPPFQLGEEVLDSDVVSAIQLALELVQELSSVTTIHLGSDSTVTLELSGGITALLSTTQDRGEQIYTLQSILANKEVLQDYQFIDVRFTRPVLK